MTDRRFAPMVGPWTEKTNIDATGTLYAVFHLQGLPSDLADAARIDAVHAGLNHNALQLGHPSIEWYQHFTRAEQSGMTPLPPCPGWYARRFDAAYTECLGGKLYHNDLWFTVGKRPPANLRTGLKYIFDTTRALVGSRPPLDHVKVPYAEQVFLDEFEDLVTRVEGGIASLGASRLQLEHRRDGRWYNQIDEAYHLISNNFFREIPVSRGRCSYNVTPYPIEFGNGAWSIKTGPASERFGVIFGLKNYPVWTNPKMFDELRKAEFGFTLTNSFFFSRRSASLKALGDKFKHMVSSGDVAADDVKEVKAAENRLASGHNIWGRHQFSLAVHSKGTLDDLDRKAVKAETILSNAQLNAVRESKAIKPAYYAQLPSNRRWRTRPQPVPSEMFADFAALHGLPSGRFEGRWGPPIVNFRTTADTEYPFHFHVQGSAQIPKEDLGSIMILGPSGSGKAQPLDAKVHTPTGFRRMGDLVVGDLVTTPDGRSAPVTGVYPQGEKEIYRVTFADGRSTECCDEHLWKVWHQTKSYETGKSHAERKAIPGGGRWQVRTLAEIRQTLAKGGPSARSIAIPPVAPYAIEMRPQDLPIPPYALGALLGNACFKSCVEFSTADAHTLDRLMGDLPDYEASQISDYDYRLTMRDAEKHHRGHVRYKPTETTCNFVRDATGYHELLVDYDGKTQTIKQWSEEAGLRPRTVYQRLGGLRWPVGEALGIDVRARASNAVSPLLMAIDNLDLKASRSQNKFVPEVYKRGSVAQRLALLQGLLDTDGSVEGGKGTCASFTSTSEQLAKDVQEIAWSLGAIAKIAPRQTYCTYKGVHTAGKPSWRVTIVHPDVSTMFSLPRKVAECTKKEMRHRLHIASIDPVGKKLAQCIAVDHPDHLYVTDNYLVTHNTGLLGSLGLLSQRQAARLVVVDKDYGLAPMINANGGAYLVLTEGEPTGLAPLRALTNSPKHVAYLTKLVRMLILSDDPKKPISSEEDERLQQAVALQVEMPPQQRGLAGIAVALGQKDREGARMRLRKWCWGERLGWVLDCPRDLLDTTKTMMGYDTTTLLKNEEACSPILNYIFYRTEDLINGQPIVFMVDEFWSVDKNEAFSADNNDKLTTIRKNEGIVALSTQSAHTALQSRHAHTFRQQIPTKIFFADADATREDLIDGMGLTEPEFHAVKVTLGSRRHQFLVKRPGGSVICTFDLGKRPDQIAVISGRRSTFDLMNRLKDQYGERPEDWVPHFEKQAPGLVDKPVIRKLEVVS